MDWRHEIDENGRKKLITNMYHELSRVSGETDHSRIWSSAAKFELKVWNESSTKDEYRTKLSKKIHALSLKESVNTSASQSALAGTASGYSGAKESQEYDASQSSYGVAPKQQQASQNVGNQYGANGSSYASNYAGYSNGNTGVNYTQQQKNQQILAQKELQLQQRIKLLTREKQQLLQQQKQEESMMDRQFQQQVAQLQQANQAHNLPKLQQQQQLKRQQLKTNHQRQQRPLLSKHQQLQAEIQEFKTQKLAQQNQAQQSQAQQKQQSQQLQTQQKQVQQAQAQKAQAQMAQQRNQQRTQAGLQAGLEHKTPASAMAKVAMYEKKLKALKDKYWEDLLDVLREFNKLAAKPKGENSAQHMKVASFLQNLKRAMAVLNKDTSNADQLSIDDLHKVEQHIVKVVVPIMGKLRAEKVKQSTQRVATNPGKSPSFQTPGVSPSSVAANAARSQDPSTVPQRPSVETNLAAQSVASSSSFNAEQYKSFKLTQLEKSRLQATHEKLKQSQAKVVLQQQRAKTPITQAKLAQQAQKVAENIAQISQQIAQSRLADEYEKTNPYSAGVAQQQAAKRDEASGKIPNVKQDAGAPSGDSNTTGLSASQQLLFTIQTFEKSKTQSLSESAKDFAVVSLAQGSRLTLSNQLCA